MRELETLKEEVQHKQALMAHQLQSRQEDEGIKVRWGGTSRQEDEGIKVWGWSASVPTTHVNGSAGSRPGQDTCRPCLCVRVHVRACHTLLRPSVCICVPATHYSAPLCACACLPHTTPPLCVHVRACHKLLRPSHPAPPPYPTPVHLLPHPSRAPCPPLHLTPPPPVACPPLSTAPQALRFQAQQRMWAMEQEQFKAALQSKVRDEVTSRHLALEAKQQGKLREWEAGGQQGKMREWEAGGREWMGAGRQAGVGGGGAALQGHCYGGGGATLQRHA